MECDDNIVGFDSWNIYMLTNNTTNLTLKSYLLLL